MKLRSIALAGLLLITMRVMEECDRAPISLPVGGGGGGGSYTAPAPAQPAQPAQPPQPIVAKPPAGEFKAEPSPSPSASPTIETHAAVELNDCLKMAQLFKRMGRKIEYTGFKRISDPRSVFKVICEFQGEDASQDFYVQYNYANHLDEYATETEARATSKSRRREDWKQP